MGGLGLEIDIKIWIRVYIYLNVTHLNIGIIAGTVREKKIIVHFTNLLYILFVLHLHSTAL